MQIRENSESHYSAKHTLSFFLLTLSLFLPSSSSFSSSSSLHVHYIKFRNTYDFPVSLHLSISLSRPIVKLGYSTMSLSSSFSPCLDFFPFTIRQQFSLFPLSSKNQHMSSLHLISPLLLFSSTRHPRRHHDHHDPCLLPTCAS